MHIHTHTQYYYTLKQHLKKFQVGNLPILGFCWWDISSLGERVSDLLPGICEIRAKEGEEQEKRKLISLI